MKRMKSVMTKAAIAGSFATVAVFSGLESAEAARLYRFASSTAPVSGHIQFDEDAERADIGFGIIFDAFPDAVEVFSIDLGPSSFTFEDLELGIVNRLFLGQDFFGLYDGFNEVATFTFDSAFQVNDIFDTYEDLLDGLDGATATLTSSRVLSLSTEVTFAEKVPEPALMLGLGAVAAGLLAQKRSHKETA